MTQYKPFASIFMLALIAGPLSAQSAPQPTPPSVFGYADFTA
jgi:hypothetical protein